MPAPSGPESKSRTYMLALPLSFPFSERSGATVAAKGLGNDICPFAVMYYVLDAVLDHFVLFIAISLAPRTTWPIVGEQ